MKLAGTWQARSFAALACLVLVTFALPIKVAGVGIREFHTLAFFAVTLSALFVYLGDSWPLRLLGVWCVLVTLVSGGPRQMTTLLLLAGGFALYRVTRAYVRRGEFLEVLTWVALAQTAYQLMQAAGVDPIFDPAPGATSTLAVGYTGQADLIAVIQALGVVAAWQRRRWAVPVLLAGLCVSGVATAWVALGAVVAGWGYLHLRRLQGPAWAGAWALCGALFASGLLGDSRVQAALEDGRWSAWEQTAAGVTLAGHGLGSYSDAGIVVGNLRFRQAHNEFLQAAYELGAVGLVLVCATLGSLVLGAARRSDGPALALLAVVGICSLALFPFHAGDTAVWCIGALGVASHAD